MPPDYSGYDSAEPSVAESWGGSSSSSDSSSSDEGEVVEARQEISLQEARRQAVEKSGRLLNELDCEWLVGKRSGNRKVVFEGALYTVDLGSKDGKYLFGRCDRRGGCSSRLWINAATDKLHLLTGEHNHEDAPWRVVRARVRHEQFNLLLQDTNLAPTEVVKRTTAELGKSEQMYLSRRRDMAKAIDSRRKDALMLGPAPKNILFEFPESLRTFANGDRMLLFDSGAADPQRILIFGDSTLRSTLVGVETIYCDGTFKRCPLQHRLGYRKQRFSQCFVVLVERSATVTLDDGETVVNRVCLPIVHALLPGESEEIYVRFFKALKEVLPELRPTRYKSDYERAAINAVKQVYPGITCEGDTFHLVQAIMRRLKKLGLQRLYRTNVDFYHQVRLMLTPMYVPTVHVETFWHETVKPMVTSADLKDLVEYIEKTWIGRPPTEGARGLKALFPPEMWNQHAAVMEGRPRHNNFTESNNAKLQRLVKRKPSVFDFALALRSAYRGDYALLYEEFIRGELRERKKAEVAKDRAILNILDTQGERPRLRTEEWANSMAVAMKSV